MDRQIIYAGSLPLETDLLNTNKNVLLALGQFAQDVFGQGSTGPFFTGLACVPNTPAAMNVVVQPGAVYAQAVLDATAYSSLAADSTVTMKQGILKTAQTFATPAPTTSGQSVVYLISAAFLEADTNAVVLPYYNASNPAQAYSGPGNTGSSQNTTRQDTVQLTLTAGVPATTGSQLTPATPSGQTALYTVTVAYGATSVTAANIASVSPRFAGFMRPDNTPGRLLNVVYFGVPGTSSYSPSPGTTSVVVEVLGGGGGGGGCGATSSTQAAAAGGGGAGSFARGRFTSGFSGAAVTVGVGGASGAVGANQGGSGGASSFGALLTAPGGYGGPAGVAAVPPFNGSSSGISGTPSGANVDSGNGASSIIPGASSVTSLSVSGGAASVKGGGGLAFPNGGNGQDAITVGAGGGGAASYSSQAGFKGGAGTHGYVVIYEYGTAASVA